LGFEDYLPHDLNPVINSWHIGWGHFISTNVENCYFCQFCG
jgi:hypothetical protein